MYKKMKPEEITAKIAKLKGDRSSWESHWQELMDHINPRKNSINVQRSDGAKRNFQLLDNVGVHSNELLAGALHSWLTNPNSQWLELTTGDLRRDSNDNVRTWLQGTQKDIINILNNSNFQTEVHEMYLDLPSIGTSAMLIEEDDDLVVRFTTKFIADYFIDEDAYGEVNQLYCTWDWTPQQIISEFGIKNVPACVKEQQEKDPNHLMKVQYALYPKNLVDMHTTSKEFIAQVILSDEKEELDASTFATFPYLVPRWSKSAGEKYGRSPGMNALPELKVLNRMNETMLIGAQKMVDPPLQMDDDGVVLPLITRPGGINFRRPGSSEIRPIFSNTNIEFGYQAMADRRQRVRDAYFVDKLQLQQQGPAMTATEVMQRTEDSIRLLGPMLGRMQTEFLKPLIERVFDVMVRQNRVRDIPEELSGVKFFARYSSLIAKSQRAAEGQAIMKVFQGAAPFIQIDPSVAELFNGRNIVKIFADVYGSPVEMLRTDKELQEIQEQKQAAAQAQQEQQAQMAQVQMAQTAVAAGTGQ